MPQVQEKSSIDTNSSEFKNAVAEQVAVAFSEYRTKLEGDLTQLRQTASVAPGADDKSWIQSLALALSEMSDQGNGRRFVTPEAMAKRNQARERMVDLILKARADGTPPTYKVRAKVYLDNMVVEPKYIANDRSEHDTVISFDGVPNSALEPINDIAIAIYKAFGEWTVSIGPKMPEDRLAITRGGHVVRGAAAETANRGRRVANTEIGPSPLDIFSSGSVSIHNRGTMPHLQKVQVLGTIAPPAERMV